MQDRHNVNHGLLERQMADEDKSAGARESAEIDRLRELIAKYPRQARSILAEHDR